MTGLALLLPTLLLAAAIAAIAAAILPWVSSRIGMEVARVALAAYREHERS